MSDIPPLREPDLDEERSAAQQRLTDDIVPIVTYRPNPKRRARRETLTASAGFGNGGKTVATFVLDDGRQVTIENGTDVDGDEDIAAALIAASTTGGYNHQVSEAVVVQRSFGDLSVKGVLRFLEITEGHVDHVQVTYWPT